MKQWKALCKKLLFPPLWLMLLLSVLCTASLISVFLKGWDSSPGAYVVYVLSFYTLTVICIFLGLVLPRYYRTIRQKIYDNKYGNRYMTDAAFKIHVSLWLSLGINLLYAAANLLSGVLYQTIWFAILAGYYMILAVMRFLLLRFVHRTGIGKNRMQELRRSRLCGYILMTLNLSLSGAVLMIIYQDRGYEYPGVVIYVMALYTFYITTQAIINLVRYRKYHSPVMSTAKAISFAAALVSMLALETAMLSQFAANESPEFRRIMIIATGAGVSVIVVTMSITMIVRASKEIQALQRNHSQTQQN